MSTILQKIKKRCPRYIGEIKILSMITVSSKQRTDMNRHVCIHMQTTFLTGYARNRVNMNISRTEEFYFSFILFFIVWIFKTMSFKIYKSNIKVYKI